MFYILIIFHCVFDWIPKRVSRKVKENVFLHCLIYTFGFFIAFLIFKINFLWLLLIFFSHLFIDKAVDPARNLKDFEECLSRKFKININKTGLLHLFLYWLVFVTTEQLFHVAILFIIIKCSP